MKYIDKLNTPYSRQGVAETQGFIRQCWNGTSYENLTYEEFKDKSQIENILVSEQADSNADACLCCYCMRKLNTTDDDEKHQRNVTLEHIVPHHISQGDWDLQRASYEKYGNLDSNHILVCIGGNLANVATPINALPYPHFISYHNLSASCNGRVVENGGIVFSHCCNNMRGNNFVDPLYLRPDVGSLVQYDAKGNLDFDDSGDVNEEWFDKDHLNLKAPGLNLVRRLWYLVSRTEYTPSDVIRAESDDDLKNDILDTALSNGHNKSSYWMSFYNKDDIWNLFSEYSWFFYYYKKRYSA